VILRIVHGVKRLGRSSIVIAAVVCGAIACASSTGAGSVPLGGACQSADECDDNGGTQLRWCCDKATDGRSNVCRSTNCYGIK
jgi:hypothetical protein